MQRRLERTIRKQKRLVTAYKAAGLKEDAQAAQIRLNRLNTKYTEFSKAANLPEYTERKNVAYSGGASTYAKSANGAGSTHAGEPELVGEVDFSDKQSVLDRLRNAEKELQGLDHEVNYSVTSDGKVWRVSGESATVDPSNIPSSLKGSYSYHNHPEDQTYYSFSAADVAFFIKSGEAYAKASDNIFEYIMRRTKDTVEMPYEMVYHRFKEVYSSDVIKMEWDGIIDPDIDEYHEIVKILSGELHFNYERYQKD